MESIHRPPRTVRAAAMLIVLFFVAFPSRARAADRALGIDVSQWQLDMNFQTAYDQGARFAFVRSSRGGTTSATGRIDDPNFTINMEKIESLNAGGETFYAAPYHFGRPDTLTGAINDATIIEHAQDQANHFYEIAGSYMTPGHLRPVLDLEVEGTNGTTTFNKAQNTLWANTFMDRIEELSGVEPLIYCNSYFASDKLDSTITSRDLWLARPDQSNDPLLGQPPTPLNYPNPYGVWNDPVGSTTPSNDVWSFWQYSVHSPGSDWGGTATNAIDLDVANGDIDFVRGFLVPEPASSGMLLGAAAAACLRRRRARKIQEIS